MTQDEIIKLAMEYGFTGGFDALGNLTFDAVFVEAVTDAVAKEREAWPTEMETMERQVNILTDELAKAVKAEREACAQICEERAKDFHALFRKYKHEEDAGANMGATQCMDLIRARGEA